MAVHDYDDLLAHVGHEFECVTYADGANVALECMTCGAVVIDFDSPEPPVDLQEQVDAFERELNRTQPDPDPQERTRQGVVLHGNLDGIAEALREQAPQMEQAKVDATSAKIRVLVERLLVDYFGADPSTVTHYNLP